MWKSLLLIAAAASFGVMPAAISTNSGQEAKPAHRSTAKAASESQEKQDAVAKTEALSKAKKLYEMDCALCHGDSGNGKTDVANDMKLVMSDWTDPASLAGKSDQDLFDIIRKGKGKMPAEGPGRAKDDEVRDLVTYIRILAKAHPTAAPGPGTTPAPGTTAEPAAPTSPQSQN